jgi:hypothetical protein
MVLFIFCSQFTCAERLTPCPTRVFSAHPPFGSTPQFPKHAPPICGVTWPVAHSDRESTAPVSFRALRRNGLPKPVHQSPAARSGHDARDARVRRRSAPRQRRVRALAPEGRSSHWRCVPPVQSSDFSCQGRIGKNSDAQPVTQSVDCHAPLSRRRARPGAQSCVAAIGGELTRDGHAEAFAGSSGRDGMTLNSASSMSAVARRS